MVKPGDRRLLLRVILKLLALAGLVFAMVPFVAMLSSPEDSASRARLEVPLTGLGPGQVRVID